MRFITNYNEMKHAVRPRTDSNFMIIQMLGIIIVFKSYWPNISAADGG